MRNVKHPNNFKPIDSGNNPMQRLEMIFSQRQVCMCVTLQTVAAASPATHCAVFPVIASRAAALEARQNSSWHQFQNPPSLLIVVSSRSCCGTLHSLTRVRSRLSMHRPFASRLFFTAVTCDSFNSAVFSLFLTFSFRGVIF